MTTASLTQAIKPASKAAARSQHKAKEDPWDAGGACNSRVPYGSPADGESRQIR